jgi:hypothetical protein
MIWETFGWALDNPIWSALIGTIVVVIVFALPLPTATTSRQSVSASKENPGRSQG